MTRCLPAVGSAILVLYFFRTRELSLYSGHRQESRGWSMYFQDGKNSIPSRLPAVGSALKGRVWSLFNRYRRETLKSLSEALLLAEHGENMLCTKNVLNVKTKTKNNFCAQHVLNLYFSCTELVSP